MVEETTHERNGVGRRNTLKLLGAVSCAGLAGCFDSDDPGGDDNGDGTVTFRWGGSLGPEENQSWEHDSPAPWGIWRLQNELAERSDGELQLETIGEGQLCNDGTCNGRIDEGVIELGSASIENSSGYYPANAIWTIPYTFPGEDPLDPSIPYTHFAEETWDRYWVPLAQEYGTFPLYFAVQQPRQLFLAEETEITHPDQIEGLSIRRTLAETSEISIEQWGANALEVEFGDIVSGMREGLLDGYTVAVPPAVSFGIIEETEQIIQTSQAAQGDGIWVDVDWLKSLSDEHIEILAEATRDVQQHHIENYPGVLEDMIGFTDPPAEGSILAEEGVTVTSLTDSELQDWKDPLLLPENPGLYDDIIQSAEELTEEGIYDYIFNKSRENAIPNNYADYEIESWWDEHLDKM